MLKVLAIGTLAVFATTFVAGTRSAVRAQTPDIVDTAVAAGSFKTLAKALDAAGLVETLKGAGPFTVFAPTWPTTTRGRRSARPIESTCGSCRARPSSTRPGSTRPERPRGPTASTWVAW